MDKGEYKETRTGNRTEQVYRDGHRVVTEVAGDGSSTITDYPADKPVVKQNDAGEAVTTFERVEEPIRITKIRSDGTIASQQRFPTPEEKGAQEEKRKAGAKRDRELAEREEAEIKRQIPQLAVRAAPLARSGVEQAVLDTPLDNAFVLGDEISSLQGHLRRQEGVVEDNRRRANIARNQGDTAQRNAYLAAADGAETKAQQLRDQIARKESERGASIEEVRRVGSSAYANVRDAMSLHRVARDEAMGNAIRRLPVRDARGSEMPQEVQRIG